MKSSSVAYLLWFFYGFWGYIGFIWEKPESGFSISLQADCLASDGFWICF